MRTCSKCHLEKSESQFYMRDAEVGKLHAQCKDCYREHRKTYYAEHYRKYGSNYRARARVSQERIRAELHSKMVTFLKNKSCLICGEDDMRVLEFDHLDPSTKKFTIARAVSNGMSWDVILNEIGKCRLLCANCHKRHTAQQWNWYRTK